MKSASVLLEKKRIAYSFYRLSFFLSVLFFARILFVCISDIWDTDGRKILRENFLAFYCHLIRNSVVEWKIKIKVRDKKIKTSTQVFPFYQFSLIKSVSFKNYCAKLDLWYCWRTKKGKREGKIFFSDYMLLHITIFPWTLYTAKIRFLIWAAYIVITFK